MEHAQGSELIKGVGSKCFYNTVRRIVLAFGVLLVFAARYQGSKGRYRGRGESSCAKKEGDEQEGVEKLTRVQEEKSVKE